MLFRVEHFEKICFSSISSYLNSRWWDRLVIQKKLSMCSFPNIASIFLIILSESAVNYATAVRFYLFISDGNNNFLIIRRKFWYLVLFLSNWENEFLWHPLAMHPGSTHKTLRKGGENCLGWYNYPLQRVIVRMYIFN